MLINSSLVSPAWSSIESNVPLGISFLSGTITSLDFPPAFFTKAKDRELNKLSNLACLLVRLLRCVKGHIRQVCAL